VFASFVINAIADGITFSFGVFYVEFLDYFGEGKAKTAWIGSLFMAMPLLSGPVASFLTDRYGCRKVTIVGSILACSGFMLSTLANSIEVLFLTFGILAGFGLSLCYVAAVVIVAYYFDKRRSFATGLSVCGSGIGTFIFAPFTQYLLDLYGWRGTTLILAGIFLNMTICGLLMRDLEWTTHRAKLKRKKQKLGRSAESFSVSNSTNTGTIGHAHHVSGEDDVFANRLLDDNNPAADTDDPRLFSSLITLPTFVKNGEKVSFNNNKKRGVNENLNCFSHYFQIPIEVLELLAKNRNVHEVLMQKYPSLLHSRSISESFVTQPPSTTVTSPVIAEDKAIEKDGSVPVINKVSDLKDDLPWLRRGNSEHHHHSKVSIDAGMRLYDVEDYVVFLSMNY
jgi:MFS transporter, MCT family, solute carrier family 16 (monocarboxylic acid transporters), member 9